MFEATNPQAWMIFGRSFSSCLVFGVLAKNDITTGADKHGGTNVEMGMPNKRTGEVVALILLLGNLF